MNNYTMAETCLFLDQLAYASFVADSLFIFCCVTENVLQSSGLREATASKSERATLCLNPKPQCLSPQPLHPVRLDPVACGPSKKS